jgi:hypothetical protein
MHWLDEAIATLTKEAQRWKNSHGDKAESHATAATILTKIAESGATHAEVKAQLVEEGAAAEPVVPDVRDRVELVPPVNTDAETPAG